MPLLDNDRWFELYLENSAAGEPRPAVFLDRDGVIIHEKHYLRDPGDVELYPGVTETLARLRQAEIPVVVVTNQSGIGQGMFDWSDFHLVHERILETIPVERPFAAVYANAHHPSQSGAAWRKPNPGMFLQAADDLRISLENSLMVGDKLVDLQAAHDAGVGQLVHVLTGHGRRERSKVVTRFPDALLADSLGDVDIEALLNLK